MRSAYSKILFLIALWGSLNTLPLAAQNCLTDELFREKAAQDPRLWAELDRFNRFAKTFSDTALGKTQRMKYIVPVVVHIVHNNGPENISDEQVWSQIQVLNEDFLAIAGSPGGQGGAYAQVEFFLARKDPDGNPTRGVTRTVSSFTEHCPGGGGNASTEMELKNLVRWPPERYLNIWVVKSICNQTLGYAWYTCSQREIDGIVVGASNFGRLGGNLNPRYNKGRTTTHEVGHWLDLQHIFQGCYGGSLGEPDCELYGDFVCDTPPSAIANYACLRPGGRNTCVEIPIDYPDMTENYMDYTPDECMFRFTPGQVRRMHAAFNRTCEQPNQVDRRYIYTDENLERTGYAQWLSASAAEYQTPQFIVYPNPSHDVATMRYEVFVAGDYEVSVWDVTGKQVWAQVFQLAPGLFVYELPPLPEYFYILRVRTPQNQVYTLKMLRN
jgi:hypothetical protein